MRKIMTDEKYLTHEEMLEIAYQREHENEKLEEGETTKEDETK